MKIALGMLAVFLGMPVFAAAQTPNAAGHGYLVIGPVTTRSGTYTHIAVGGDSPVFKGITAGVEFGTVFHWSGFYNTAFALGSANVSYHFSSTALGRKTDPFITAGYSIFIRAGTENGANAGGGINVWVNEKVGVRLEFRGYAGHVRAQSFGPRIGIAFR
jgi:hypothetical protein